MQPPVSVERLQEQIFETIEEGDQLEPSVLFEFGTDHLMPESAEEPDIEHEVVQAIGSDASASNSEPQVSTNQTHVSEPIIQDGFANVQVRATNVQSQDSEV